MGRLKSIDRLMLLIYAVLIIFGVGSAYFGYKLPGYITGLTTMFGFTFVFLHSFKQLGLVKTILLVSLTFVVSMIFEAVGVATGIVYGPYHYTLTLGPKFLGLVPYLIALAWFMMAYPSFIIAVTIIPPHWSKAWWKLGVAATGGVIMTAWDMAMDPMMVAGGHWVWEIDGAYFGVPLQNFWGWWLTIFVTIFLFMYVSNFVPNDLIDKDVKFNLLAVTGYAITGLSSVLLDLRIGLQGAGLAGFFAMLPWVMIGLITISRNSAET